MNTEETSGDANQYVATSDTAHPTVSIASNVEAHSTSSQFSFPPSDQYRFQFPQAYNVHAAQQYTTAQPTQAFLQPQMHFPPFMNYQHAPYYTVSNVSPAFSSNSFPFNPSQPSPSRLRFLAPKPALSEDTNSAKSAAERASLRQPPDFIETVQAIRRQLYVMAGLREEDEPLFTNNVHTEWRKSVIEAWKPVSHVVFYYYYHFSFCNTLGIAGHVLFHNISSPLRP